MRVSVLLEAMNDKGIVIMGMGSDKFYSICISLNKD